MSERIKNPITFSDFGVTFDLSKNDHEAIMACIKVAQEQRLLIELPLDHVHGQRRYLRVFD